MDDILHEIAFLSELNSPFITKYYDSFIQNNTLYIVMELCEAGSVLDLMKGQPLTEETIAQILCGVLQGLDYLHFKGKIHRDIKAANILITKEGQVKLADFGVSAQVTATITKKNTVFHSK
jgi:serine/threonine-protein kinase 24/25/MST4